jgi:hypothetical protein
MDDRAFARRSVTSIAFAARATTRAGGSNPVVTRQEILAQIVYRLIGEPVEPAGLGVALDLLIEPRGIERLEPGAEFRELFGRQRSDGFFEVFDGHGCFLSQMTARIEPENKDVGTALRALALRSLQFLRNVVMQSL